jgi:hypothetical protein
MAEAFARRLATLPAMRAFTCVRHKGLDLDLDLD